MSEPVKKISKNGTVRWYRNNQLHRTDGPAIEYDDGSRFWYVNDQLHRTDGPVVERANGDRWWYLNGQPADPATVKFVAWAAHGVLVNV